MTNPEIVQLATIVAILVALTGNIFAIMVATRRMQAETAYRVDKRDLYFQRYGFYGLSAYASRLRDFLVVFIAQAEARHGISLTPAARELLIIPVIEAAEENPREFDLQAAQGSIDKLIAQVAEYAGRSARERPQNAKSIVRAFFKRFCNIPPFCDGEGPDRR
jgi:hypothetical protein